MMDTEGRDKQDDGGDDGGDEAEMENHHIENGLRNLVRLEALNVQSLLHTLNSLTETIQNEVRFFFLLPPCVLLLLLPFFFSFFISLLHFFPFIPCFVT